MRRLTAVVILLLWVVTQSRGDEKPLAQGWDYASAMKKVAGGFHGRPGVVLHVGDSITYSNPYGQWARAGKGKTAEDQAVLSWMHTGADNDTDGWWLARVDHAEGGRSQTACSGIRADEMLAGGKRKMPALAQMLDAYKPQLVVLMLGTNDVSANRPVDAFRRDMEKAVDLMLTRGVICILSTIPPHTGKPELAKSYNEALRQLARVRELPLIDFEQEILKRRPNNWNGTLLGKNDVHPTTGEEGVAPTSEPTPANLLRSGYLLRGWLSVQKIAEVKRTVLDGTPRPHVDGATLTRIAQLIAIARLNGEHLDAATMKQVQPLVAALMDAQVRADVAKLLPAWEQAAVHHAHDRVLLAEIKRLGGTAILEVRAPDWLRSIVGDDGLQAFGRIVEIELNERTDGHKEPTPKKLSDRVTDDWLKQLADQTDLRRLELSGTAITSAGLVHLKGLTNLERLNVCLTAVDDRGFEHLAGLTRMRRMVVCSSKITGTGFQHLQAMKQLESINLHSSPASDAGLEAIGKLTSLQRLEIVHTKVTDAGLKHLAGLVQLRQLHVHGPETTEAALPFLGQLRELYQLDVYDRAASNQTLEQIGGLPRLRILTLVNGVFDDDGVKHLSKLSTLEELTLDSPRVTDASVDRLAGLTNLRKLHLGRARLTAAGKERLKGLLPAVEIAP